MSRQIQRKRGTTAQNNALTGAAGEITVDTTKQTLVVHDGMTAGGYPVAAVAQPNGTINLIKKDGTSAGIISSSGLFYNGTDSTATDRAATAAVANSLQTQITNNTNNLQAQITNAYNQQLGIGQSWKNVTGSRSLNTTYTNDTGRPIVVNIAARDYTKSSLIRVTTQGVTFRIGADSHPYDTYAAGSVIIALGATYSIAIDNASLETWHELRN